MKKFRNTGNVIAMRRFNADVAISLIKESMNKESLFTRAACFWRLLRLRLAMTFSTLTFVLSLGTVSESWAACVGATATTAGTDEDGDYCGTWDCGATGSNVTCTLSKGTLTISGEGEMKDYGASWTGCGTCYPKSLKTTAPWSGKMATKAVIEGNVTRIGNFTFAGESYLTEIRGTESLISIGSSAFNRVGLVSIDIPNVLTLDNAAFHRASDLQYINMRDDIILTNNDWFGYMNGTFLNVDVVKNSCVSNPETGMKTCGSCGDKFVQAGAGCVDNCFDGYYATNYDLCEKIKLRYTLPEADAATSDDNENMIEWIFE